MAAEELEIRNREELQAWLTNKHASWAQVIAARVALRALPLIVGSSNIEEEDSSKFETSNLALFRAFHLSWAASKYSIQNLENAGFGAAEGAEARVASTAAYAAIDSSYAVLYAVRAAHAAGEAANTAMADASLEVWQSVTADADFLLTASEFHTGQTRLGEQEEDAATELISQPLWLRGIRENGERVLPFPRWAQEAFDRLSIKRSLREAGFDIWFDWYRALLPEKFGTPPNSVFGEEIDLTIAKLDDSTWKRPAAEVNAEINSWIENAPKPYPIIRIPLPLYSTEFIVQFLERENVPRTNDEIAVALDIAKIPIKRSSLNWTLSGLVARHQIGRLARGIYASNTYLNALQSPQNPVAPPPEPIAGPGPQYRPKNGKLTEDASLPPIDEATRQNALHRRLRLDAAKLEAMLLRAGNRYPELSNAVHELSHLLNCETVDLDVTGVWSVGNSVASFAYSYREQNVARTLADPLEPEIDGVLQGLVRQYGAFVMGFAEGRDLVQRADEFAMDTNRLREIEQPGIELLNEFTENKDLVDENTRALHKPVRDSLVELGWSSSRVGYVGYLIVRNCVRATIKYSVGDSPDVGSILGLIAGVSLMVGDPNVEFARAALPVLQHYASQLLSFFNHSPEMRAYVEWALNLLEEDHKNRTL